MTDTERDALAAADYLIGRLRSAWRGIPVRDLEEAEERYVQARAALGSEGPGREPVAWQGMSSAPKDGTAILLQLKNPIPREGRPDLDRWHGLQFVGRHPGLGRDGFDVGWNFAAPVGSGGFPDDWFVGWRSLDAAPVPSETKGLREAIKAALPCIAPGDGYTILARAIGEEDLIGKLPTPAPAPGLVEADIADALKQSFREMIEAGSGRQFDKAGVAMPGDAVWFAYAKSIRARATGGAKE